MYNGGSFDAFLLKSRKRLWESFFLTPIFGNSFFAGESVLG
ncbi:hypothetical protein LEP1GSC036_0885 [Leptospira weilii str. 2006001853]|uniref:Uncharacterized protein n=1 Tax=Leptospira weilii str. 2006001853 TaxID=1001589 RepID=A0A828Z4W5_9LEPT|nr:hypothetical protein LEP1GSC036_0885 [Leptospira weilii str. 2006001853]